MSLLPPARSKSYKQHNKFWHLTHYSFCKCKTPQKQLHSKAGTVVS